jgi:uncharacterized protein DUF3152
VRDPYSLVVKILMVAFTVVVWVAPARAAQVELTYQVGFRGVPHTEEAPFALAVAQVYADPRGWSLDGSVGFRRVESGGDFTIWLAAADQMTSFSSDCSTSWSCRVGRNVVINEARWDAGSPHWHGTLGDYRTMLVNHETGHFLGLDHEACPGAGMAAPIMMQQSKGVTPCVPNSWPLAHERQRVAHLLGVTMPAGDMR